RSRACTSHIRDTTTGSSPPNRREPGRSDRGRSERRANATTESRRARGLEAQVTQSRVVIGAAPERPVIFAVGFRNRKVVDRRKAGCHEAIVIELPVLIAIGAMPVTRVVVPLVSKAYRDAITCERP